LFTSDNLSANGNNSIFTLTEPPADANTVFVTVDGVVQRAPVHYTTSGTTITFTSAPAANSNVHVRHLGFRTSTTVTAIPAGTSIPQPNIASPTLSGTVTHSSGTANGVAYLNGSKVLTTGSALVFDGTNFSTTGTIKGTSTISVGAATPSTSGAGITFPATQSASTDANTLDDYEEGTWTPAMSTTTGSISFSSPSGTYTKIGRLVYVRASFGGTVTISSPTGDLKLTSLPFTIGSPEVGAGSTTPYNMLAGAYSINLETIASTTTAYIFNFANGTRSSAHSYFQTGCFVNLSMCYQI
jgi:hypothetical protein